MGIISGLSTLFYLIFFFFLAHEIFILSKQQVVSPVSIDRNYLSIFKKR